MSDTPRLIERAFPLKQTSLASVHEKNVRHGHISTLHIWPARRPLAACRAALIATLLPDPGTPEKRKELCERIGGKVVQKVERKPMPGGKIIERLKEETEGGILTWIGTEPKDGSPTVREAHQRLVAHRERELQWFREEIRKVYGGRAPRVLDPFAGGGAIPLEAMRLGCEATAVDINPVAWFILKCTLEYPQKLAGKTHPLPDFILGDEEFMEEFYRAHPHLVGRTKKTKKQAAQETRQPGFWDKPDSGRAPKADLAWHVRAWGRWVLNQARRQLAPFYPTYADFEPLDLGNPKPYERHEMRLVPTRDDGTPDIESLNADLSLEYLADKRNPRWVAKPTVAYLWARTVTCKNCRATVPLLKTRWLCKKDRKRVLLTMEPNPGRTGVVFGIQAEVPAQGGNAAQRREYDKRLGAGTMSRAGAKCPCCGTIMTMEDIRVEGKGGQLGMVATAMVTESRTGKAYRLPTRHEIECAGRADAEVVRASADIPFGLPDEDTPAGGTGASRAFSIKGYGIDKWRKVFASRQLRSMVCLVRAIRGIAAGDGDSARREALAAYLCCALSRLADRNSIFCTWQTGAEKIGHTFARYALPITWDFVEVTPWAESSGGFGQAVEWVAQVSSHCGQACPTAPAPKVANASATVSASSVADIVVTDPPYYDAIPYSDCMDFFHVWLRRALHGVCGEYDSAFAAPLSPKWNHERGDGELIDDAGRHGGDAARSKSVYEDGMARAFAVCHTALTPHGRMVIVFAHKQPDAWETLVAAMIRAGFVVDGSWPIQTERPGRMRAMGSAALSSSVWLVCKKRPLAARPGWDAQVLAEMRANITTRLRDYWDAGIRGPDFVWAATGPALEAYSQHPVVKKANEPGQVMPVGEFLTHVRRMVVDFVVGQVLSGEQGADLAAAERMDAPTAYYLLHRHDFGLKDAPAGACILYATACGLSDRDLEATWDLVAHKGAAVVAADDDEEESDTSDPSDESDDTDPDAGETGGSMIKLKDWAQRTGRSMGYDAPSGRPVPLIDRVHRLMHLWKAGDVHQVDEYLDDNGLRRQELFRRLVQSLIELSERGGEERTLLESLSNHIGARGAVRDDRQQALALEGSEGNT